MVEPTLRDSVFGKNIIKELPENFFETVLACEVKLKKGYNKHVFQELLNYYNKAIEYYESRDDPRYLDYNRSINLLLTQPEIAKHFKKEKDHTNHKLEVKKKFDNRDKEEDTNKVSTLLRQVNIEEDKVSNIDGMIDQEINTQLSAFQKRKEAKKKKKEKESNSNSPFESSVNDDKSIKLLKKNKITIVAKNKADNNKVSDVIQMDIKEYLNKWSNVIQSRLIIDVYNKLDKEYKEKENELLKSTQGYTAKIQECELLLTNDGNQAYKDRLGRSIIKLEEEKKESKESLNKKYLNIPLLIQEYITNELSNNKAKKDIDNKFKHKLINNLTVLLSKD